ncbi:MAG: hypothetical protein ACOX6S_04395 [Clostridia bacterium]|jgi:hypothetical protein
MSKIKQIHDTFEKGEGILRLIPTFVPAVLGRPEGGCVFTPMITML